MVTITDVTLCTLKNYKASEEVLTEIYELLLKTGINFIEVNIPILKIIENKYEIDRSKTILRVEHPDEANNYNGFYKYICRYSGFSTTKETIAEIQINDIREINLLSRFSEYKEIRIVGLDDLILHDYLYVFDKINKYAEKRIEFCPQNSFNFASALAVEWVLNGGKSVVASFNGGGGFAALEEVIMALRIAKRYKPNVDLSVFRRIKELYEIITGEKISGNKAVIGEKIFNVESGIHVDGIYKNGSNYEPFDPSIVGMERKVIVGKHSGRTTIEVKLKEHGIEFPENRYLELLRQVQHESITLGRSITDDEFVSITNQLINM